MKFTEVFLNKFITGDNAASFRQVMGLSVEEVNFMITEIGTSENIGVAIKNSEDAVDNSFEVQLTSPTCAQYEALRFLFYNINQSTYGATAAIIPTDPETDTDNLDTVVTISFTPQ